MTMEKNEIMQLLGWALANFPHMQEREMAPTAQLWLKMLDDIPYQVAEVALLKILATAKFFPNIAEIREAAFDLLNPQQISGFDAWEDAIKAIRRFGRYREAETYEAMDPEVAAFVRSFGLYEIIEGNPDIVRAQFMKQFEARQKSRKEQKLIPAAVHKKVAALIDGKEIKTIGGGRNG
jgi:hypothetical protein